jgi:hypothetical protein
MTRESPLQARRNALIKAWLTPYLRDRGFTKKGNVYTRLVTDVVHIIDVQQESYNKDEAVSFALNIGVHIPGVLACAHRGKEPEKLFAAVGIVHTRPGQVVVPKRKSWWYVNATDDPSKDHEIGRDLQSTVEEGAFRRFFDRFQNKRAVAEFHLAPREKPDQQIDPRCESRAVLYAGIIWDQLGEYDKCRAAMARAAELAHGKRLEADIEKFAREYVCGQLPRVDSAHVDKE